MRYIIIYTFYCLLFIFAIKNVNAQNAIPAQSSSIQLRETGLWNGLYLKVKFSKKLGYYGEHHYRLRNSSDNLYDFVGRNRQIYNRAGLNIYVNPHFEIVVGPTLVFNFTPAPGNPAYHTISLEPRIWHQWLFSMPQFQRIRLFHQFRFEHRWKKENLIGSTYKYTNRYRYKVFAYIPLNSSEIKVKTLFASPSAEIFLQSGKSIVYNPFEDFRTYNGIGYVLNKNMTFFVGHMWTLGQQSTGFEYRTSHIIRVNLLLGFDVRNLEDRLPTINLGY